MELVEEMRFAGGTKAMKHGNLEGNARVMKLTSVVYQHSIDTGERVFFKREDQAGGYG